MTTRPHTAALLLALACALALFHGPASAQAGIELDHDYTFGQTATFTLSAPAAEATQATLYLRIDGERTQTHPVALAEGRARHRLDLRETPLPPFARITYWWEIEGAQDEAQTSPQRHFLYADNRFAWQTIEEGRVTLRWVDGETATMRNALDVAQSALIEIETTLQAPPVESVTFYIYPSLPDLQSALRLSGREWVGGQAYPEIGVLLLTMPPSDEARLKMTRDIPHELTHKVLYDLAGPQGYSDLPHWLVEGLASIFEQSPDPAYALALQEAAASRSFLPLETLCHPFPTEHERAVLAYAQSQSLVAYIQRTHGWSSLRALIAAYSDGLDCESGVQQVLESDLDELERAWQAWLTQKDGPGGSPAWGETLDALARTLVPWLLLLAVVVLPSLTAVIDRRVRAA